MAAHNMIQKVWVPLHIGTDGNETADHILISTFMTSDCLWHIYKGCHRNWKSQKLQEYRQSIHGQRQDKDFLKRPSAKRDGELLNLSRNQLRIECTANRPLSFKRTST